jgi:uncharacterized repeat protein (TIGR01451 family)
MVPIAFLGSQPPVWRPQRESWSPTAALTCRLACLLVLSLLVVAPAAFGTVTISVDAPSSVQLGTGLRYLIQVTNTGGTSANALVMTDTLPSGVSATSLPSNCAGTTTVICDIGTLAAGQSTTIPIEVVPFTAPATLANSATVTGGNTATASTNVINNGLALVVFVNSSDASDFVTSSPPGISCAGAQDIKHRCYAFFPSGTPVTLTASGPNFVGWSVLGGSCPGTGPCSVTMTQEQQVAAGYTSPLAIPSVTSFGVTGVLGIPFAVDASDAPIGGTPPYTFSFSGVLPAGLTANGSVISGTPTVTGPTFPVTLQVTDSAQPTQGVVSSTGNIAIISAPNTQASLLNGSYALLIRATNDGDFSERAFVGTLTFDGLGGVTSGTVERNCNNVCVVRTFTVTSGSSYSIGPDNRGLINLNLLFNGNPAAPMTFAIAVGEVSSGVASRARVIRFDDNNAPTPGGARGAGELRRQNSAAFTPASLAATYVFGMTGEDPSLNRVVEAGLFSMNATNEIPSGTADVNDNGAISNPSFSGTYTTPSASPAGRTTLTLNLGGGLMSTLVSYVIDANNLFLMTLDSGATSPVVAGTAQRQVSPGSFSLSSLAGPDVISLEGLSGSVFSSNSEVFLGILTATSAGGPAMASITYDANDNRLIQIQQTESGSYAVAANGRSTLNVSAPSPLTAYLIDQDQGFVMATSTNPGFGEIALQTGGPFSNSSFAGHGFSGDREPASPSGGPVNTGTGLAEACTVTFTNDESHARGTLDYGQQLSTGFAVSPSGRVTSTFAFGNLVTYLISQSRGLSTVVDPQEHHPHIVDNFSISLTPEPRLTSIAVTPATTTIGVGQTKQYTATGIYSDQSTKDLTGLVNWVSSDLGVATLNASGLASGAAVGTASILASFGCLSSSPVALSVIGGSLVVTKNTVGGDGTFTFSGTGSGIPASFQITTSGNTGSYPTITNLTPGSSYSISEQSQTGWDQGTPICTNGTPSAIVIAAGQTTTCTFTNTQRGTIVVRKVTNPNPDPTHSSFSFTDGGGLSPSTFSLTNGTSQTFTNLVPTSGYSVSETTPNNGQTGWALTTVGCTSALGTSSKAISGSSTTITLGAGDTMTCTYTNSTARTQVTKTFNGGAIPPGASFTFQLRSGASSAAAGNILESQTFTSATSGGTILFTTLLIPGQQYEMCEQLLPGWMTTLGPPLYSVFNPSGDNSVLCTNFIATAGQTTQFRINNQPPPGGLALTIGFWKNWASCASSQGQQRPVLDQTLASFPGGGVYVGNLFVNTCQNALKILNKSTANGTKAASSPAYNLAAQLLASELNIQAGAGSSTCVVNNVAWSNDILNPVKDALGHTGIDFAQAFNINNANPAMTSLQVTDANYLQTQLNNYNNNLPAQCSTTYQF